MMQMEGMGVRPAPEDAFGSEARRKRARLASPNGHTAGYSAQGTRYVLARFPFLCLLSPPPVDIVERLWVVDLVGVSGQWGWVAYEQPPPPTITEDHRTPTTGRLPSMGQ